MDRTVNSQIYNEISNNDTLFDTRYTRLSQLQEQEDNWFTEQRAYSKSVLAGWGLPLGQLPYSPDNEQTLRAVSELIGYRQKDLQFRTKAKEDIAAINFQKEKYRSFMEQAQRNLEECMRKLGRSENDYLQLKTRNRKIESISKKERDEDKKMISMLRTKNEQILHEIKKKEQEVNKVKEQMKKSVGEKTNIQAKNSFEIFQGLSPYKRSPEKEQSKYAIFMELKEKEINQLVKENNILREKLFQLREELLNFNEWIDQELFGESDPNKFQRNSKFPLSHNLIFKKESLVDEFSSLLETAKDGIIQLRDLYKGGILQEQKLVRSSQLLPAKKQNEYEFGFKKKLKSKPSLSKTERSKDSSKDFKEKSEGLQKKAQQISSGKANATPRSSKQLQSPNSKQSSFKNFTKSFEAKQWEKGRKDSLTVQPSEVILSDELLSDVLETVQDSSIVSHIEVSQLGKNKFDKWDILYQDDE